MLPERVARLSVDDQDLIRKALRAGVEGPYFPDWEIHALLGVSREELAEVLAAWPDATATASWETDAERVQFTSVNNVLANFIGYPHNQWDALQSEVGVERPDLVALLQRWRGEPVASYFDALM